MIVNKTRNHTLYDTLREIERLALNYAEDMEGFKFFSVLEVFEYLSKTVRYEKDPKDIELVCRPKWTLKRNAGDCDDKTVCFLAYAYLKELPAGYSVVSEKPGKPYHHIFPFILIKGTRLDMDITYNYNKPGNNKKWAKRIDKILIKEK